VSKLSANYWVLRGRAGTSAPASHACGNKIQAARNLSISIDELNAGRSKRRDRLLENFTMLQHATKAALAFLTLLTLSTASMAASPFDAASFKRAQAAGKTILVDVAAPWCPVCQKQRPIIQSIEQEQPQMVVFAVDFDNAKDVLKRFGVRYQSTLIVFKGSQEAARSTGEVDPARIRAMVAKGL
jgi:thioredoxin 1